MIAHTKKQKIYLCVSFVITTIVINTYFLKENQLTFDPYLTHDTKNDTIYKNKLFQKFDPKTDAMVFIHIGKAGGTSFDSTISKKCFRIGLNYIGFRHFDWSYVDQINGKQTNEKLYNTSVYHGIKRWLSHLRRLMIRL